jgi:hypothetical protein
MRSRGWCSYAVAATLVFIQVSVSAVSALAMCVDRPHTHGGVPAPDCVMHGGQPVPVETGASTHSHHSHHDGAPADGARLACSCSADLLTLLTTEIAVIPAGISVPVPNLTVLASSEGTPSVPDARPTPLSPPPRTFLSRP